MAQLWIVREIKDREWSSKKYSTIALSYELMYTYSEDAVALARDCIKARLREANPDLPEQSIRLIAGQIYRFANEMQEGDFVLTPIRETCTVLMGKIVGAYVFDPQYAANFGPQIPKSYRAHTRSVQWCEPVSSCVFSGPFQSMLNHSQQSVFQPGKHAKQRLEEFLKVLQAGSPCRHGSGGQGGK